MRLSERGLRLLKESEGCRLEMYDDSGGACTIGVGHLIHKGGCGTNPQAEAPFRNGITEELAKLILLSDVTWAERTVERYVSVPLAPYQFDALVLLTFNIGAQAFKRSTLLKRLNRSDYTGAAQQFGAWVYDNGVRVQGLIFRRARERALFEGD